MSLLDRRIEAEKELIRGSLEKVFFSRPEIQQRLAYYAYASIEEKNHLICELMKQFWTFGVNIDLFPVFERFDLFLTASGRRGHFIHQFEVFLLGLHLIYHLWEKKDNRGGFGIKPTDDFNKWLMVSTAHDLGRPLEVASKIAEHLGGLYRAMGMNDLAGDYDRLPKKNLLMEEFNLEYTDVGKNAALRTSSLIREGMMASLNITESEASSLLDRLKEKDNHGYISAAILCKTVLASLARDSIETIQESRIYRPLLQVSGAIALHTIKHDDPHVDRIRFDQNPYAYLLLLVDNIQDWSRPFISEGYPSYNLTHFVVSDRFIEIRCALEHEKWTDRIRADTQASIDGKRRLFSIIEKSGQNLGLDIYVFYQASDGSIDDEICFSI